jgi:zinc transport system substrate-binding protein
MKKQSILFITVLFVLSLAAGACAPQPTGEAPETSAEQPLQVTVSILPQAYFVERIGGDRVSVNVMVQPGESPHSYEPKPDQMIALTESALFFTIGGVEYEQAWLPRFEETNPQMEIVDTTEGIDRIMETTPHTHEEDDDHAHEADDHHDEDDDHAHETDDDHAHHHGEGFDTHVWLSPKNGKIIAKHVVDALVAANPENESYFTANYEALIAEIDTLDNQIKETLSGVTQRNFMVYHPAWAYFAADYGLTQIPIEQFGSEPSASELAALIDKAQQEDIRVIFVQPTFDPASAQAVAEEIGGEIAMLDPLAPNWLANLQLAADTFAAALGD